MKDFKKWTHDLAGLKYCLDEQGNFSYSLNCLSELDILVRTMWAINDEAFYQGTKGRYFILDTLSGYRVHYGGKNGFDICEEFFMEKYNNRQQALQAALEYVFNNKE